MATCKDCIHHGVCGGFTPTDLDHDVFDYCREGRTDEIPDIEQRCNHFTDKSRFVELPCKVGDTVYRISRRYGVREILPREVVNLTYYIDYLGRAEWWIFTTVEDKLGETVFLTREEAEAALAERMKEK